MSASQTIARVVSLLTANTLNLGFILTRHIVCIVPDATFVDRTDLMSILKLYHASCPPGEDMFDFLKTNPAIALLKDDHERVKDLFDLFEKSKSRTGKEKIVRKALVELKVHAAIEEELFYPAVRKPVGKEIMNEADEEHHVAKLLIAELDTMDGSESHFEAKFMVLAENVRHHIKEEEDEMLPKSKAAKVDFEALSQKMLRRKEKLLADGVPAVGEERMVKASRGKGDSPAQAAKRKPVKLSKTRKR